jgi:hypothetical protein
MREIMKRAKLRFTPGCQRYLKSAMAAFTLTLAACTNVGMPTAENAPTGFSWASSSPLIIPPADAEQTIYGVKDPSVVYYDGKYHVFLTTAGENGWGLAYTAFSDWQEAPTAPMVGLDKSPMGPGYRAAPQVFFFEPQQLWYLVYQGGDPLYSTSSDISDPTSWSEPKPFYASAPEIVKNADGYNAWLDFWTICDDNNCYLFFTNDEGDFYRAQTTLQAFPHGFRNTVKVITGKRDDVFEASNTYKIAGSNSYLTLIEAISPEGRYFRAWISDNLAGDWQALTPDPMNVFASADNLSFVDRVWSEGVSHGEMVRSSVDQTLTIDPCKPLQFLFQGLDKEEGKTYEYIELPYSLGLLTATTSNPISAMCNR